MKTQWFLLTTTLLLMGAIMPQGIAQTPVWITNFSSADVTKLNSDGSEAPGSPFAVGNSPYGIAVDASGSVWVANLGSHNVTKLNPDGTTLGTFTVGSSPVAFGDFTGFAFLNFTLPVELSAFTAHSHVNGVTLNWRTESETNNVGFNVYRGTSKDGEFPKIGFVDGHGSTPVAHDYTFADQRAKPGGTYYPMVAIKKSAILPHAEYSSVQDRKDLIREGSQTAHEWRNLAGRRPVLWHIRCPQSFTVHARCECGRAHLRTVGIDGRYDAPHPTQSIQYK